MNYSIFHRLAAASVLLGVCVYLPAVATARPAASDDQPRTEVVSYADLNLADAAGQRVLMSRIQTAASHVCGPDPGLASLRLWGEYGACMRRAQYDALHTVAAANRMADTTKLAELATTR